MDKFDYITATIEEEKVRVEKIIKYLKEHMVEHFQLKKLEIVLIVLICLQKKE